MFGFIQGHAARDAQLEPNWPVRQPVAQPLFQPTCVKILLVLVTGASLSLSPSSALHEIFKNLAVGCRKKGAGIKTTLTAQ